MAVALDEVVAERIGRLGPLRFDQFVELALYHDELGFYTAGSGAGRAGADFLTSPEVGPLFGAVMAGALDTWWEELGRPDPYVVVEAGAGSGALARSVIDASGECSAALRYVLVERSPAWRAHHARVLPLEPPLLVLGTMGAPDPDHGRRPVPGRGPLVASLPDLPATPFDGVILANELLDNLPFRLLERSTDGGWLEIFVASGDSGVGFAELAIAAPDEAAAEAEALAPGAPPGARVPLQHAASGWFRSALHTVIAGRVVVVDYMDTTANLARRPSSEWLRTYRGHGRGGDPLEHLGEQDVTCEVAVDQLAAVRQPASDSAQSDFLRRNGLDELVEEARRHWEARAHVGDLDSLKARSRVTEAAALTDPSGLGAFRVLEWAVGAVGRTPQAGTLAGDA